MRVPQSRVGAANRCAALSIVQNKGGHILAGDDRSIVGHTIIILVVFFRLAHDNLF